jgi:hypothetical protein
MLSESMDLAAKEADRAKAVALERVKERIGAEVERLCYLREINDHIGDDEVEAMESMMWDCCSAIEQARLRLDSLRPVFSQNLCG